VVVCHGMMIQSIMPGMMIESRNPDFRYCTTVPWVVLEPGTVYCTNIVQYRLLLPVLDYFSSIVSIVFLSNIFAFSIF
jgi:hypothetical protein